MRLSMRASERWFTAAYGIWLFGLFAYFVPAATWNPVSRFDLTRAIVEHGTLSIDAYADNTGDRALSNGRWYTEKAPIPCLLAVPAYALVHINQRLRGQAPEYTVFSTESVVAKRVTVNAAFQKGLYVCSLSTSGIGTAVLGVLLFHVLRRRFSPAAALTGSASAVLGTPLLPYATSFYGHAVAAAFIAGAFVTLFPDQDEQASSWRLRAAGAFLALAAGSEYLAIVPGLVLFLVWLVRLPRTRILRCVFDIAAGAVIPLSLVLTYHSICFGAPWRTGYAFVVRPEFVKGHASGLMGIHPPSLEGLYGLAIGERRGLFFLAPFTTLALAFGVLHAVRSKDVVPRAGILAFMALLLVNAGYYMWWGGAAAGPRHLVPALAFLSFGVASAWQTRARWILAPLVLVSVANFLVLTAVGLEGPDHGNLLFDYAYARLSRGEIAALSGASNWGLEVGMAPSTTILLPVIWIVVGARFLFRKLSDWVPSSPAQGVFEVGPS